MTTQGCAPLDLDDDEIRTLFREGSLTLVRRILLFSIVRRERSDNWRWCEVWQLEESA